MRLPGVPVPASVYRTPTAGGGYQKVLDLTLRRFMGVLFQAQSQYVFNMQEGGAVYKRHACYADWPHGVVDPIPVHPNDELRVPFEHAVTSTVQATPAPTLTSFAVGPGVHFASGQAVSIGGQSGIVQLMAGSVVTLTGPLSTLPVIGATVTQLGLRYPVDDADCFEGNHIKIYVRLIPHNA